MQPNILLMKLLGVQCQQMIFLRTAVLSPVHLQPASPASLAVKIPQFLCNRTNSIKICNFCDDF